MKWITFSIFLFLFSCNDTSYQELESNSGRFNKNLVTNKDEYWSISTFKRESNSSIVYDLDHIYRDSSILCRFDNKIYFYSNYTGKVEGIKCTVFDFFEGGPKENDSIQLLEPNEPNFFYFKWFNINDTIYIHNKVNPPTFASISSINYYVLKNDTLIMEYRDYGFYTKKNK